MPTESTTWRSGHSHLPAAADSGLQVTDACGGLIAAISGRNVKRLLREPDLSALDQPIEQFLTEIGNNPTLKHVR
jgi:hypothetical protein